jgi:hypothetical protein
MAESDDIPPGEVSGSSPYLQQENGRICRHDRNRILPITLVQYEDVVCEKSKKWLTSMLIEAKSCETMCRFSLALV